MCVYFYSHRSGPLAGQRLGYGRRSSSHDSGGSLDVGVSTASFLVWGSCVRDPPCVPPTFFLFFCGGRSSVFRGTGLRAGGFLVC